MREWLQFIFRLSWSLSLGELQRIINIFAPQKTAARVTTGQEFTSTAGIVDAIPSAVEAVPEVAHTGWSPMDGAAPQK